MTRHPNEDGFTMVELVVAVLILAIIMGPLTATVVTGLFTTQQAQQRTSNSADEQLVASYFVHDVQSSDSVSVPAAGAAACTASGTPVAQFDWQDPVGPVGKTAVYTADGGQLLRVYCDSSGVSRSTTVVGALASTPTAMCTTGATTAACPAAASKPQAVTVDVTGNGDTQGAVMDQYTIKLAAARRVTG